MSWHFCERLMEYQLSSSDSGPLYSTYIACCIFFAFLSYTAVMLNIITIYAMRKTSSLPKPLRTFLLSLAVSDLGVGLLCEPFTIAILLKWLRQNDPSCTTYSAFLVIVSLFCFASFFGIMVISVDRFVALHLHLRYQELVSCNRAVTVVISLWTFSVFLSLITIWIPANIIMMVFAVIATLCMVPAAFINYKIYSAVRRHRHQIRVLQVQQVAHNGETVNAASVRKSAQGTFYIYVVSLLCFVPQICSFITMAMPEQNVAIKAFSLYTLLVMFLNSSLNPVIYCWKMRHIRQTILNILRKIMFVRSFPSARSMVVVAVLSAVQS